MLERLKRADGRAECGALRQVGGRDLQRSIHHAEQHRRGSERRQRVDLRERAPCGARIRDEGPRNIQLDLREALCVIEGREILRLPTRPRSLREHEAFVRLDEQRVCLRAEGHEGRAALHAAVGEARSGDTSRGSRAHFAARQDDQCVALRSPSTPFGGHFVLARGEQPYGERLIEERLIDNIVQRLQLAATETEVNEAVTAKARENGLTVEQLRQSIAGHGLTFEEYRTQIKNLIERQRVLGSIVRARVRVEDEEVEAAYRQQYADQRDAGSEIHLRHLLIGISAEKMRDQSTACRIAADIRDEVATGGTSFAQAARLQSDTNAERGGDLGWVHVEELAGWMAPALADLQPGEVSDVIPMPFGCNLLMLVDHREFEPVSFEQARASIEKALFNQKIEQEYEAWIEKLRKQVYIERKGTYAEASRLRNRTPRE